MDDRILEPEKAYREYYKSRFKEYAEEYFGELVKQSGIDVEKNRQTCKDYRAQREKADASAKKLSSQKAWRVFLIVLCVIGFVCAAIGIFTLVERASVLVGSLMLAGGVVVGVVMIVVITAALNPKIKIAAKIHEADEEAAQKILEEAQRQMAPLNALFDGTATKKLIEKTVPLLEIDDDFNMRRYDYLSGKYGFGENRNENSSTIAIMTGEILGNPFVIDRELYTFMGTQTYTGSIVISWTTTYTDSEGHTHTQTHTQTLFASVDKPKPFYSKRTRLIYGNEAAPKLSFSREPSHAEDLSEGQLARKVKKGYKKLKKLQDKQMKDDDPSTNFTTMGNEEFDVLFGATDRDNETEFRLLFTPLAQKNMLDIMKSQEGFGDDFSFRKDGCLNFISSEHSASWTIDLDYRSYFSYDVDMSALQFITLNCDYFKSLYFEFAPLLAIPLYQQHKPHEYIYKETYERNYTGYEAEYAANRLGERYFAHGLSATQNILKAEFLGKDDETDKVRVTAYSYRTVEHVEIIPVWGGDGHMHNVPVPWTEYIPVSNESIIKLKRLSITDREFDTRIEEEETRDALGKHAQASTLAHGILCCLVKDENAPFDEELNRVFKK